MAGCSDAHQSSQLHRKSTKRRTAVDLGIQQNPISKIANAKQGWQNGSSGRVDA
jgi:hypothetical protein